MEVVRLRKNGITQNVSRENAQIWLDRGYVPVENKAKNIPVKNTPQKSESKKEAPKKEG